MSKQYIQSAALPTAHPTSPFSLTTTPHHLLSASGGSAIQIHSLRAATAAFNPEAEIDAVPYPLVQTLEKAHTLGCHHIVASSDGKVAASAGFGGEVKVWGCSGADEEGQGGGEWGLKGTVLGVQGSKAPETWALALSPDGRYLAATTHTGGIDVFDTDTVGGDDDDAGPTAKTAAFTTKGSFGLCCDISPDGNLTASGHANGSVYIFNNAMGRLVHSLPSLLKPVRCVRFSPTSRYLAACGDSKVMAVYDTQSGEQVSVLGGHGSWVMSCDWSATGEWIVSGGWDGRVKVWGVERGESVATVTGAEGEGGKEEAAKGGVWGVRWLPSRTGANQGFVVGGAGGGLSFYREASGT